MFDDEEPLLMRVVNLLIESSLELVLDFSPPLTYLPKVARASCLGFFSFLCSFFF